MTMRLFGMIFMALLSLPQWGYSADHAVSKKLPYSVRFMSQHEASRVLSDDKKNQYYHSLNLNEIRAKTGLALESATVEDARKAAREFYASETLEFTNEEKAAIQDVLQQLYPLLKARAKAYIATPWCFIKVSMRVEDGFPHTHNECIVLSSAVLDDLAVLKSQKRPKELFDSGASLIVHEQTHVLQRKYPDRFYNLYIKHLGFQHMVPAPSNDWLREIRVVNPGAMDVGWAYPVPTETGKKWMMPYVVLKPSASPPTHLDFMHLGITVKENERSWELSNASPAFIEQLVTDYYAYVQLFPAPDYAYHPNELSAEIMASWLTDSNTFDLKHPISIAMLTWAKTALQ